MATTAPAIWTEFKQQEKEVEGHTCQLKELSYSPFRDSSEGKPNDFLHLSSHYLCERLEKIGSTECLFLCLSVFHLIWVHCCP